MIPRWINELHGVEWVVDWIAYWLFAGYASWDSISIDSCEEGQLGAIWMMVTNERRYNRGWVCGDRRRLDTPVPSEIQTPANQSSFFDLCAPINVASLQILCTSKAYAQQLTYSALHKSASFALKSVRAPLFCRAPLY